jgi:NAD(P)-dependent dehydrogenase (short-subunit alcohol dehydrogenase family)
LSQAVEAAEHSTRVKAIAPGFVFTPILGVDKSIDDWNNLFKQYSLLQRVGTVEAVAQLVCFLLADEASLITGSVQVIDGGCVLT